jgi:4-carboxymuconolactone decarboxylase
MTVSWVASQPKRDAPACTSVYQRGSTPNEPGTVRKRLEDPARSRGDKYVDASLKAADEFSMPMQELVTQFCWGEVWSRPGLDRRSRSILNLGMIAAQNKPEEFAVHVRGALRNGITKDEIQECLLQIAVYCGMPTGLGVFRVAKEVFKELDA